MEDPRFSEIPKFPDFPFCHNTSLKREEKEKKERERERMPSYTIYAEMTCGGCSGAITRLLSKLDGVTEVKCDIVRIFSLDFTLTISSQ